MLPGIAYTILELLIALLIIFIIIAAFSKDDPEDRNGNP